MYKEKELLKALSRSYKNYIEYGPRSTMKLKPLHEYIAKILQYIWGKKFEIHYLSDDTKEMKVEGKYYDKDIDITVSQKDNPVMCLGIKFVTSNYKQNSNNYFENMMGETANIQARKDLPYFQLIFLRYETPYYKRTTQGAGQKTPLKIEILNKHDLSKYIKLIYDHPQAHRPYAMGLMIIDIDEKTYKIRTVKAGSFLEKDYAELINNKLSLKNFFTEIKNFKTYYAQKS